MVILCGGRGTRLREQTQTIPKPLVEIGGRPILWHVIRIYAEHGFERFVLCTGHKGELIEDFVANDGLPSGLDIECLDTGEETQTGGRIARVAERLGGERFCATYADGVADIDLAELLRFHARHGALATMTVVQPELQFGVAELNGRLAGDGQLRAFRHPGFWDCMDTYKDAVLLNDLWADGRAPWKVWA